MRSGAQFVIVVIITRTFSLSHSRSMYLVSSMCCIIFHCVCSLYTRFSSGFCSFVVIIFIFFRFDHPITLAGWLLVICVSCSFFLSVCLVVVVVVAFSIHRFGLPLNPFPIFRLEHFSSCSWFIFQSIISSIQ